MGKKARLQRRQLERKLQQQTGPEAPAALQPPDHDPASVTDPAPAGAASEPQEAPVAKEEADSSGGEKMAGACPHAGLWELQTVRPLVLRDERPACGECPGKGRRARAKQAVHDLWLCLGCAHIGCGREQAGHAAAHAKRHQGGRASHAGALELGGAELRVWCYACDHDVPLTGPAAPTPARDLVRLLNAHTPTWLQATTRGASPPPARAAAPAAASGLPRHEAHTLAGRLALAPLPRGLVNLGNTCFFNATMQCVLRASGLRAALLRALAGGARAGPMGAELVRFVAAMSGGAGAALAPSALFGAICHRVARFRGHAQQDAHEALHFLLDCSNDELLLLSKQPPPPEPAPDHAPDPAPAQPQKEVLPAGTASTAAASEIASSSPTSIPEPSQVVASTSVSSDADLKSPIPLSSSEETASVGTSAAPASASTPAPASAIAPPPDSTPTPLAPVPHTLSASVNPVHTPETVTLESAVQCHRDSASSPSDTSLQEQERVPSASASTTYTARTWIEAGVGGTLESVVTCHTCRRPSVTRERFLDLSLSIQAPSPANYDEHDGPTKSSKVSRKALLRQQQQQARREKKQRAAAFKKQQQQKAKELAANEEAATVEPVASSEPTIEKEGSSSDEETDEKDEKPEEEAEPKEAVHLDSRRSLPSPSELEAMPLSLEKCLFQFTSPELLDGSNRFGCEACTADTKGSATPPFIKRRATKQLLLSSLPPSLILHLKRFEAGRGRGFQKLGSKVRFPVVLNLAPFTTATPTSNQGVELNPKELLYRLSGVVVHSGTMSGGHYTCYVQDEQSGKWFYFSDSHFHEATLNEVLGAEAYILFYTKHST